MIAARQFYCARLTPLASSPRKDRPDNMTKTSLPFSSNIFDRWDAAVSVIEWNASDQKIILVNPAYSLLTGYSSSEVIGQHCRFLQHDDHLQPGSDGLNRAMALGESTRAISRNYRKDGSMFWNEVTLSPMRGDDGKITHFLEISVDVTSDQSAPRNGSEYADQHATTKIHPDKLLLSERLHQSMHRADTESNGAALIFLDVDLFKSITDNKGPQFGNALLNAIFQRLHYCLHASDTLACCDHDEFAIILNNAFDANYVDSVMKKISEAIALPFFIQGQAVRITCSSGIALYPQHASDWENLFQYAHMALYVAKQNGPGAHRFFDTEMNVRVKEREILEDALRDAIPNREMTLHYQPVISLQTGAIIALEALIRWTHPVLGIVPPFRFIPIAENTDMIDEIGEWVIHQACADMRQRLDAGFEPIRVAINISPKQFANPNLVDQIELALSSHQIEPEMLCLEITEGAVMEDTITSQLLLRRIKMLGLDLLLDDFGTGFSSLSYLKRFPFHRVKIDRSFITDLTSNVEDAAITKAIISMAHSLGIRVIAEGVETEEQCRFLRDHQCDEIQGYLFSPALPPTELATLLKEGRCLQPELLGPEKAFRTVLLVDDDVVVLDALATLLRRDNYKIVTATNAKEGLAALARQPIDVILADHSMPEMTGVELLRVVEELYPETIRIVLSCFEELQLITDAINDGAVYKFLTKPWDDDQLRAHVEEAFIRKELTKENERLSREIKNTNLDLTNANRRLEQLLISKKEQLEIHSKMP